jgi:hypothetical protein
VNGYEVTLSEKVWTGLREIAKDLGNEELCGFFCSEFFHEG